MSNCSNLPLELGEGRGSWSLAIRNRGQKKRFHTQEPHRVLLGLVVLQIVVIWVCSASFSSAILAALPILKYSTWRWHWRLETLCGNQGRRWMSSFQGLQRVWAVFFFFKNNLHIDFIFGCVGSWLRMWVFSSAESGATLWLCVGFSLGGFSNCKTWALGAWALAVVAHRL